MASIADIPNAPTETQLRAHARCIVNRLRKLGKPGRRAHAGSMDNWGSVDTFACSVAGPAWRAGRISDAAVECWSRSRDRWWWRAARVATVPLNARAKGGSGDPDRMLGVCSRLAGDPDDPVVKALSWALRELVSHAPGRLRAFLAEHDHPLAARVTREVQHELAHGTRGPQEMRTPAARARAASVRCIVTRAHCEMSPCATKIQKTEEIR